MKDILQVYKPLLIDKGFDVTKVEDDKDSILLEMMKDSKKICYMIQKAPSAQSI